ncbi:Stress response protein NhaX [Hydrogenophaga sp. T4]|nr:Stress response protein NhaX [Hydrogenophaga sp. T4]
MCDAPGEPAKELVVAAKQFQSNLLVMGCRGQSAIESMVLGSVTAAVLAHSHVPVLVVR